MTSRHDGSRLKVVALMALAVLGGLGVASGQPANDHCENAQTVGEGTFSYDNTLAGPAAPNGDGDTAYCVARPTVGDLWYRYVPTVSGTAVIELTTNSSGGGAFAAVLTLANDCELASTHCSGDGDPIRITRAVTAGAGFLIRIAGETSDGGATEPFARGTGELIIRVTQQPANDVCASARAVGEGSHAFDTTLATTDGASQCAYDADSVKDVWFRYTPTFSGWARIHEPNGDTVVSVYSNCSLAASGAPLVESSTHGCEGGMCSPGGEVVIPVVAGQPWIVRVAGEGFVGLYWSGPSTLDIEQVSAPPVNDRCTGAIALVEGANAFNTTGATVDCIRTNAGCVASFGDVWYVVTPSANGAVEVISPGFDQHLSLWSSCITQATGIERAVDADGDSAAPNTWACTFNPNNGVYSLRACVAAGQTYYLRFSRRAGSGTFTYHFLPGDAYQEPATSINAENEPCPAEVVCSPEVPARAVRESDTFAGCPTNEFIATGSGVFYKGSTFTSRRSTDACTSYIADQDWYRLTVTQAGRLVIEGQAEPQIEARLRTLVPQAGGGLCGFPAQTLGTTSNVPGCSSRFRLEADVTPGEFAAIITRTSPMGALSCSQPNRYWLRWTLTSSCRADFNGVGGVTVQDIFDFLAAYFTGDVRADINGVGGVTVQDIFDFLSQYFAGC